MFLSLPQVMLVLCLFQLGNHLNARTTTLLRSNDICEGFNIVITHKNKSFNSNHISNSVSQYLLREEYEKDATKKECARYAKVNVLSFATDSYISKLRRHFCYIIISRYRKLVKWMAVCHKYILYKVSEESTSIWDILICRISIIFTKNKHNLHFLIRITCAFVHC